MVYLAIPQDSLGKSIASLQQLLSHTDTARTAGGLDMARGTLRHVSCAVPLDGRDMSRYGEGDQIFPLSAEISCS
jgi:hypothetical protein